MPYSGRMSRLDPALWGLVACKLGLHLVSVLGFAYGYAGDETYYLACADHLDWGYVDHPPLSIWLLGLVRAALGDSLPALRLVPALAGAATLLLVAQLARELGGGRTAARLAALAALTAPAMLTIGGFYSMNALDLLSWAAALLLVARLIRGQQHLWPALGAVLALGLLNKLSVLWLVAALGLACLATPYRRWLRTPGPWLAAGLASLGLLPYLGWQLGQDWATLEFIRHGSSDKLLAVTPWGLLGSQVVIMGPLVAPLWGAGLVWLLRSPAWRPLGLVWLAVFALLAAHGHVRAYYLVAAYPPLLAAGGVAVERLGARPSAGVGALLALSGLLLAPLALPLMPPEPYLGYAAAIGLSAPVEQVEARGTPFPLHFAAQLSGPPIARGVARAHRALSEQDKAHVLVLAQTYTEASAVDFFGRALGLPRAASYRNAYWTWGPPAHPGEPALVLADRGDALLARYASCAPVADIDCAGCLSHISRQVWLCRGIERPLAELWPELREFK
jgi:hypothetical protein